MSAPTENEPSATRSSLYERLSSPATLVAAGVVLGIAAFQLWTTPSNPPGFIRDEASISYNAYTLSQNGRDQDGGLFPLSFTSFGDHESPF